MVVFSEVGVWSDNWFFLGFGDFLAVRVSRWGAVLGYRKIKVVNENQASGLSTRLIWKPLPVSVFPLIPSPSPHKFGVRLIKWHIVLVRICGEKGANSFSCASTLSNAGRIKSPFAPRKLRTFAERKATKTEVIFPLNYGTIR